MGLRLLPDTTFADCPKLDVICVPGGPGVNAAMQDDALVTFVRSQAAGARYVTSVCTGALVLGAAGLLRGKRAATHWAVHDLLARFGAVPVQARVVRDGRLVTGGGVTAGIDFALTLVAEMCGAAVAQAIQLGLEYAPAPPFDAGSAAERAGGCGGGGSRAGCGDAGGAGGDRRAIGGWSRHRGRPGADPSPRHRVVTCDPIPQGRGDVGRVTFPAAAASVPPGCRAGGGCRAARPGCRPRRP